MTVVRNARSRALLILAASVVLACSNSPQPSDFNVGATRQQVLESFGAPSLRQTYSKRDDAIWGPIEDFWARIPLNSTVEVWSYQVNGGTVELYFVDESERVQGKGFAPEGVVY
jgi:hypothetical protein